MTPEPIEPQDEAVADDATDDVIDVESLPGGLAAALEAVLMVADTPVPVERLAALVSLPVADVTSALAEIAAEYRGDYEGDSPDLRPRGYELREGAQGWRIYSSAAHAPVVDRFLTEGQTSRLTQAALETLAVIAYRQPVTRGQVSAVRGVNVDSVVRTLLARELIAEVGADPVTGAVLFATTAEFLDRMGWRSLDELPPIAPLLPSLDSLDDLAT